MSPQQVAAFNASVGGYFTPNELLFVIAALIHTLLFTWLAWLVIVGYAGVARGAARFRWRSPR